MKFKILCLGTQWRGADDGSLFKAFSRQGHLIEILDYKFYVPCEERSFLSKAIVKLSKPIFWKDYNEAIAKSINNFRPDIICVYKGNGVAPITLEMAREKGIPVFCIYPDVSFFDHGSNIPKLIPYYQHIFTTKSFGFKDLKERFNYTNVSLINHCIDPDIHRPSQLLPTEYSHIANDVSFIGTYSKKKEVTIEHILKNVKGIDLKIWGVAWRQSQFPKVTERYMNTPIYGDMYAIAIQKSKINLGILSEAGSKSSSGDLITARSFHISGVGGFMLHEYTDEICEIYEDGISIATYRTMDELIEKTKYYLGNDIERDKIRKKAHETVWKYHKSDDRVKQIIDLLVSKQILK